jgi:hypothetical protein
VFPTGWTYRLWDPNVDGDSSEPVTDQGIVNWLAFGFRGLLFESSVDLVSPATGLDIAFSLPGDLLDWTSLASQPLNAAAWTPAGDIAYIGLAVPARVEEPQSIFLVAVGAALLAAGRGGRKSLRETCRSILTGGKLARRPTSVLRWLVVAAFLFVTSPLYAAPLYHQWDNFNEPVNMQNVLDPTNQKFDAKGSWYDDGTGMKFH